MMPSNLPLWETAYQQTQRWIKAGVFENMVYDLREALRVDAGPQGTARCGHLRQPRTVIQPGKWWAGGL
jgi:hypothetical protein